MIVNLPLLIIVFLSESINWFLEPKQPWNVPEIFYASKLNYVKIYLLYFISEISFLLLTLFRSLHDCCKFHILSLLLSQMIPSLPEKQFPL